MPGPGTLHLWLSECLQEKNLWIFLHLHLTPSHLGDVSPPPSRKAAIPRSLVLANQQCGIRESWSCLSTVGWTGKNSVFPPSLSFVILWKYLKVEDIKDLAFQDNTKILWKFATGFCFTLCGHFSFPDWKSSMFWVVQDIFGAKSWIL